MSDILDGANWHIELGDCIEVMQRMPENSVDFAVFSPPFPSLFAYTSEMADIGNNEDLRGEAKLHLSWFFRGLARVLKSGRVAVVHVTQIPGLARNGEKGIFDFRGLCIRLGQRASMIYQYDWLVGKNPQSQAIRTHSHKLLFVTLERDRAQTCGALGDYLIKFINDGENAVPINSKGEISRQEWIDWAEASWPWSQIRESDTLNTKAAKSESDVRHICLARGSLVLTRDGHKPIEEIQAGDMVLTHKGRWRPVTAVACNGIAETVRTFAQGVPGLQTTPDHSFWARSCAGHGGGPSRHKPGSMHACSHRRNAAKASPAWMEAQSLKSSYVNLKLPPIEESPYTHEDWWLVGRWLGDGHFDTRGSLHITCSHREVDSLLTAMGDRAGFVATTQTARQVRVKDWDGKFRGLLSRCGHNCETKQLPAEALALEPTKAESLLSGYLSADGHYVAKYDRWSASSVSRVLLLGMAMVAQRARGVVASVYPGRPAGETTIEGRKVKTQQDWVLSIPPQNVSGMMLDDGAWKKVRRVDEAGLTEVWDIQVEEDESFTAEGCIVHNCPLQLGVINRLVRLYTNPGEIVFSPFAGIGSEGYESLKLGRRFYGVELKPEYHAEARRNLTKAESSAKESAQTLWDLVS